MALATLKKELAPLQNEFLNDQLVIQGHSSSAVSAGTANVLKTRLDAWYERFKDLRNRMFNAAYDTEDYDGVASDMGTIQVAWTNSMGKLLDIIQSHNQRTPLPPPGGPTNLPGPQLGKLPDLSVPSFAGDLQEWMSFADLFKSAIHANTRLSNVARLQYLKASLKGETLQLISSIPVTDGNYNQAWTLLEDRYQNRRKLVVSLVSRLFHLPVASSGQPKDLRKLVDSTAEILQQLRELQQPVDQWNAVTTTLLGEKIDDESRRAWNRTLNQAIPAITDMVKFLNDRIDADMDGGPTPQKNAASSQQAGKKKAYSNHGVSSASPSSTSKCPACPDSHGLGQCQVFLDKTVGDGKQFAQEKRLCFNCLGRSHSIRECNSKHTCRKCSRRHHTLLHRENEESREKPTSPAPATAAPATEAASLHASNPSAPTSNTFNTLLATAMVQIRDPRGTIHQVRALLDGGSQISCITEHCTQRLQLPKESVRTEVYGLQSAPTGVSSGVAHFSVSSSSKTNSVVVPVAAVIVKTITGRLPTCQINPQTFSHLVGLQLADKDFTRPAPVEVLLGADCYSDIMLEGKVNGPPGTPTAFHTIFGWTLMGKVRASTTHVYTHHATAFNLNQDLQKFWQLEELSNKVQSHEEKECEKHFLTTHSREADGRFVVRLPIKETQQPLGQSRKSATRRWLQEEARLRRNPQKQEQYFLDLSNMLTTGHMQRVPPQQQLKDGPGTYYMPHHAVINAASTSTKLRVVFDASARSTTGISLNDTLRVGPWVQNDLLDHLLRFRMHKVALVADIVQMFRQIKVHSDDWDFQRIIWRSSDASPPVAYWLTSVVYGQASSPFLATRTVNQVAIEEAEGFPEASRVVLRDFYVDNLIGGAHSTDKAIHLIRQISQLLQSGQLPLKKWMSNDDAVLQTIPQENRETETLLHFTDADTMKTLGTQWNPRSDDFLFGVSPPG